MTSPRFVALARRSLAAAVVAAALVAPALHAQGAPVSTGVDVTNGLDNRWSATFTPSNTSLAETSAANAPVATNKYSGWQADSPTSSWISITANSSTGQGSGVYTYSTDFDFAGYDPTASSVMFKCAVDNAFLSITLNGVATTATCEGSNPGNGQFGSEQTLTGFINGTNTLVINSSGDGATDGAIVSIDNVVDAPLQGPPTTTPEPSSIALLGTGLIGLVPMVRRRIKR